MPPAAQAQLITLAPSAALTCMTPAAAERGLPEYDADLVAAKIGGVVRVELAFADAQREPSVRVLGPEVSDVLARSVLRHVQKLRVPCMPEGAEPVRLVLEFAFVPNDGRKVMATAPRDARELEQRRQMACVMRISGPARPSYPWLARERGQHGKFLVRLRFASPTAPPQAEFLAGPRHTALRQEVAEFVQAYRLPCQRGEPLDLHITFHFSFEGDGRTVMKDMSLITFLRAANQVPRPAYFELDQLGCPFDARVHYYQPFMPNDVRELGSSNPARRAFIDWLAGIALDLPRATALDVLGDSFTVTVPCGKVDL